MTTWRDIVTHMDVPSEVTLATIAESIPSTSDNFFELLSKIDVSSYTPKPNLVIPGFFTTSTLADILEMVVRDAYMPWCHTKNGIQSSSYFIGYDGQPMFSRLHPCGEQTESNIIEDDDGYVKDLWCLISMHRGFGPVLKVKYPSRNGDLQYHIGTGFWQKAVLSTQRIDLDSIGNARERMISFKNGQGENLGVKPTHVLTFSMNAHERMLDCLDDDLEAVTFV